MWLEEPTGRTHFRNLNPYYYQRVVEHIEIFSKHNVELVGRGDRLDLYFGEFDFSVQSTQPCQESVRELVEEREVEVAATEEDLEEQLRELRKDKGVKEKDYQQHLIKTRKCKVVGKDRLEVEGRMLVLNC